MSDPIAPCAFAVASNYDELVNAFRARRQALALTQLDLDDLAGFNFGYTAKIEAWRNEKCGRKLGPVSLPALLSALGLKLVVVAVEPSEVALVIGETNRKRRGEAA